MNEQTALECAQGCIRVLKEKFPRYSSSQIAMTIDVPQSTFSRLENGQGNPNLCTLSKLYAATKSDDYNMAEVIEMFDPALAGVIKKNIPHTIENPIVSGDFAQYFKQDKYRYIMLMALTVAGTTREEVKNEYGQMGLKNLQELLDSNILEESDGVIKAPVNSDGKTVSFEQDVLKDVLVDCIKDHYDPILLERGLIY